MHGDDDGERPVAFRLEEEDGHRLAVEALEAVQLGLDERRGSTARGLVVSRLTACSVVEVHVVRLDRRRERKREERAVGGEDGMLDHSSRR